MIPEDVSTIIIEADYINPIDDKSTELVVDAALVLRRKEQGFCIESKGPRCQLMPYDLDALVIDRRGYVVAPAFVDLHFHWVQDDVRLMPKDSLMRWLEDYTWPYEQKFSDSDYSKTRAQQFAQELLEVGTLAGMVYGSIHDHTVDHALSCFRGHFIAGNVLMTMNSPTSLTQTLTEARDSLRGLARKYKDHYAITPRFAPTTDPQVMNYGAEVARAYQCFIQTHLSESLQEIDFVLETFRQLPGFEDVENYTSIYHRCGILGPKTILGHALHLSDDEWKLLASTSSAIAHCPSSNAPVDQGGLGSGLFSYQLAESHGVRWALASDIGGGPYLSMFDVMQSFVRQQRQAGRPVTYSQALYRATRSGAEIMNIANTVGSLDPGVSHFTLWPARKNHEDGESYLNSLGDHVHHNRSSSSQLIQETYYHGVPVFTRL